MPKVIKVTRDQVHSAKTAVRLSEYTGVPVSPLTVIIANARPAAKPESEPAPGK